MTKTISQLHKALRIPEGYYRLTDTPEAPPITRSERRTAILDLEKSGTVPIDGRDVQERIMAAILKAFDKTPAEPKKGLLHNKSRYQRNIEEIRADTARRVKEAYAIIERDPTLTNHKIMASTDCTKYNITEARKRLLAEGKIVRDGNQGYIRAPWQG